MSIKIILTLITISALISCGVKPVRNVDTTVDTGNASMQDIQKAIVSAATPLGWAIKKVDDGHLIATLYLRSHVAIVDVNYNQNSFQLTYKDSQNLNYDGTQIHSNYNGWIQNLENAIRTRLTNLNV